MNILDYVIILLISGYIIGAIAFMVKNKAKGKGGCCSNCRNCKHYCSKQRDFEVKK